MDGRAVNAEEFIEVMESITSQQPTMYPINGAQGTSDLRIGFDSEAVVIHTPDHTRMTTITDTKAIRDVIVLMATWATQKERREASD